MTTSLTPSSVSSAPAAAATELYVYYRVHANQLADARAAFEQSRADQPVRLLQRRDQDPVFQTWMEIYGPSLSDPIRVEREVAAAMGIYAQGPRHREAFAALAGPGASV